MTESLKWMAGHKYSAFFDYLQLRHGALSGRERALLTVFQGMDNNHDQLMIAYGAPLSDLARRIAWMTQPIYAQRLTPSHNKQAWLNDAFWLTGQLLDFTRHSLSQMGENRTAHNRLANEISGHFKQQYRLLRSLPQTEGIEELFREHQQQCYAACEVLPSFVRLVYTKSLADRDSHLHNRLMATVPDSQVPLTLLNALVPEQCSFDDVHRLIDHTSNQYDLLRFLAKGDSEFGFTPAQHQDLLIRVLAKPATDSSLEVTEVTHYLHRVVDNAFLARVLALHAAGQLADGCLSPKFYDMTDKLDPLLVARVLMSPLSNGTTKNADELSHWVHSMVMDEPDNSHRQALVEILAQQPELNTTGLRLLGAHHPKVMLHKKGSWYQGSLVHWLTRPSERHLLSLATTDGHTLGDHLPDWLESIELSLSLPTAHLKRRVDKQLERLLHDQVLSTPSNDQDELFEIGLGLL